MSDLCKFRFTYKMSNGIPLPLMRMFIQELDILWWTNVNEAGSYKPEDMIINGTFSVNPVNKISDQMVWVNKFADTFIDSVNGFVPNAAELEELRTHIFNNMHTMRMNNSIIRICKEWWSGLTDEEQKVSIASVIEDWAVSEFKTDDKKLTLDDHFVLAQNSSYPYMTTTDGIHFCNEEDTEINGNKFETLVDFTKYGITVYEVDTSTTVTEFVQEVWLYEIPEKTASNIVVNSVNDIMDINKYGVSVKTEIFPDVKYHYKYLPPYVPID